MAKRALDFSKAAVNSPPKQIKNVSHHKQAMYLSTIKTPKQKATVNAVVVSISPSKPEARYFDGELTDGKNVMRMVGFEKKQRDELESYYTQLPIKLKNCEIQQSFHDTDKLEVKLKSHTQIEPTDADFNVQSMNLKTVGSKQISLDQLVHIKEFDRVTVTIKVTKADEPQVVGEGKTKQELTIADATSSAVLTLWETDIKSCALKIGQSYQLNRVQVRIFRGKYYLYFPMTGASVDTIEDIGEVIDDSLLEDSPSNELVKAASVVGINQLQNTHVYFAKRVQ